MGNVYMEADQVRFKDSTYRNVQEGLAAALEGGGGGGTTVVANPEGSATADLAKLQVGTTIYGIPAEARDISYDNTSSGMTADDVQEAIDELNTGLSGVTELIPSGATTSNKLATASDIPGTATTLAPGIVQPDGTSITIEDGVISAVGGGGGNAYGVFSATETLIGSWFGYNLYRKCIDLGALPNAATKSVSSGLTNVGVRNLYGIMWPQSNSGYAVPLPSVSGTNLSNQVTLAYDIDNNAVEVTTQTDRSNLYGMAIVEYFKIS